MFDIGILELFFVAVIALLVLGPERLPKAAREAGKWFGKAKRFVSHFSDEVNRQIDNDLAMKETETADLKVLESELKSVNASISESLTGYSLGSVEAVNEEPSAAKKSSSDPKQEQIA